MSTGKIQILLLCEEMHEVHQDESISERYAGVQKQQGPQYRTGSCPGKENHIDISEYQFH